MLETLIPNLIEQTIKLAVENNGEDDGNCKVLYLSDLNGVINLNGYTDILSAHVGEDGLLSFLVATPDDKSQSFVSLFSFPQEVIEKIIEQVAGLARYSQE